MNGPLRIRPVPVSDEPYDDEPEAAPPQVVGSLALTLPGLGRTRPPVPLRLVPPAQAPDPAGRPAPLGPVAARLAQAVAEVLAGGRSPAQLADHATLDVLRQLERSVGRLGGSHPRRAGQLIHPRVTSIHIGEPAERVAELCVVVDLGFRRRALALRLEARGQRWRCTALQLA
jgi:hypothetical protein